MPAPLLLPGLRKSATAGINQDASEDDYPMDEEVFAFGSFRLIPAQRMLSENGKPVRLGGRALDILAALTERAGETISKDELIARAWPDTVVEEAALRVHVAALRKALGDGRAGKRYIANHPGRGYAFIASVRRENALSTAGAPNGVAEAGNLPALLTRVVGRDDVISRLAQQLARHRFLTIVGPGGIGKTTVAVAVAHVGRASYRDGAWFVGLAPLSDPDLVPSAVGAALGVPPSGGDHTQALALWLHDKNALLVLDNCEHVISATATLAEAILKTAPQAGILATSREPLRAEGEWLHRLAPLELPPQEKTSPTAAEAVGYSAVELFNERATATTDSFVLNDAEVPAVLEICRRRASGARTRGGSGRYFRRQRVSGEARRQVWRLDERSSHRVAAAADAARCDGLELRAVAGGRASCSQTPCHLSRRFHDSGGRCHCYR
jgi:DNA-binding winged helix-turn-helix (wHTH) protein